MIITSKILAETKCWVIFLATIRVINQRAPFTLVNGWNLFIAFRTSLRSVLILQTSDKQFNNNLKESTLGINGNIPICKIFEIKNDYVVHCSLNFTAAECGPHTFHYVGNSNLFL